MTGDLSTFKPPTSNIPLILTISTATSTIPANTSILKNLENQRKSYLDFDIDESILISLSNLLLSSGLKLKGKTNY